MLNLQGESPEWVRLPHPPLFCYTSLVGILDFLFPKYCVNCKKLGSYLCDNCFAYLSFDINEICLVCKKASIDGLTHPYCLSKFSVDGAFSAINYKGVAKKLIYKFKYKPYLSRLKNLLVDLFYEGITQKEEFQKAHQLHPILVPIPLYKSKIKSRGYNQTEILASELARRLELRTENLLERVKNTKSQVGLKEKERKENIKDAFKVSHQRLEAISQKSFLLVDDVLTTGSTLCEAANVLKRNGAKKVWGITLARD